MYGNVNGGCGGLEKRWARSGPWFSAKPCALNLIDGTIRLAHFTHHTCTHTPSTGFHSLEGIKTTSPAFHLSISFSSLNTPAQHPPPAPQPTTTTFAMLRHPNPTNAAAKNLMARPMDLDNPPPLRGPSLDNMRGYSHSTSGSSSPSISDSDPRSGSPSSMSSVSSTSTINSDRIDAFFRTVYGRELNTMNTAYLLPSDDVEIKVRTIYTSTPTFTTSCGTARSATPLCGLSWLGWSLRLRLPFRIPTPICLSADLDVSPSSSVSIAWTTASRTRTPTAQVRAQRQLRRERRRGPRFQQGQGETDHRLRYRLWPLVSALSLYKVPNPRKVFG